MRRGFTLIELALVVLITATLTGLVLTGLARARAARLEVGCQLNIRQAGILLTTYANDHREYPPFAGYRVRRFRLPINDDVDVGGFFVFNWGFWTGVFPDQWSPMYGWTRGATCPGQPVYDPYQATNFFAEYGEENAANARYEMSHSFWVDLTQIWSVQRPEPRLKIRPFKLTDVLFPARKSLLIEIKPYCATRSDYRAILRQHKDSMNIVPMSYFAVDGSTRRGVSTFPGNFPGLGVFMDSPYGGVRGVEW